MEIAIRWQDSQIGTTLRMHAESTQVKVELPPELQFKSDSTLQKNTIGLLMDIDTYTVAPVERAQWNAAEWVTEKVRLVRRDADRILQGDAK